MTAASINGTSNYCCYVQRNFPWNNNVDVLVRFNVYFTQGGQVLLFVRLSYNLKHYTTQNSAYSMLALSICETYTPVFWLFYFVGYWIRMWNAYRLVKHATGIAIVMWCISASYLPSKVIPEFDYSMEHISLLWKATSCLSCFHWNLPARFISLGCHAWLCD